jgi:alcohol dehydrogenase (cytochrome c)
MSPIAIRRFCLSLAVIAAPLSGLWTGSSNAAEAIKPAPAFTIEQLKALPQDGWLTNGGNLSNQRFSPLNQINRDNVSKLKGVWRAGLKGSALELRHNNQGQPLIYEGVLYISTGQDDVFAISIDTGETLWSYQSGLKETDALVCCGWVSRGVGMGDGKIYIGQLDSKLVALDQKTGKVAWTVQAADPKVGYSFTAAPLYYDGMVIIGNAGGDMGTRGRMRAFNAKTGADIWTFYTIPGPGEFGHDTWPQDKNVWEWGGAPIWHTPAVDPDAGLLYFSTGNAGPVVGGGVRPGNNLFTASIVALDIKTGKYKWHFQEVHHDIWDYDAPNPIILFEASYNGVKRKGLAQAGKTGWIYLLDRLTGEPLIGIDEKPVMQEPRQATAATQPVPRGDALVPLDIPYAPENYELINKGAIFTPFFDKPVPFTPLAAVNWPPSAYDPATNLMFVCATDTANAAVANATQYEKPNFKQQFLGGAYVGAGLLRRGLISAVDLKTNKIAWQRQFNDGCRSGQLATAGGLLFMGRNDGRLEAMDMRNGNKLWEFRTDAPINSAVSSFQYKGKQYIATYAGGGLFGAQKGDGVWLFSLDGTLNSVPTVSTTAANPNPTMAGNATAALKNVATPPAGRKADKAAGKTTYMAVCVYCHGETGTGGHGGGAELTSALTVDTIMAMLSTGKGQMPSFNGALSVEQMHDIATFAKEDLIIKK